MQKFIKNLSKKTLKSKSGFTLIEFSIALAVLSILLIIILQISNNTIAIYQKGLATKAVSTAGRDLLDELTRSIASSPTGSLSAICDKTNNAKNCKENVDIQTKLAYQKVYDGQNPLYGMFCTGKYSYFWNSGYALRNGKGKRVDYKGGSTDTNAVLLRFEDPGHDLCVNHMQNSNNLSVPTFSSPVELLQNDEDLQVVLYDFTVFTPSQDKIIARVFYSGTFLLGTLSGDIDNITANNDFCRSNTVRSLASDAAYCSINKFNFAAQALGEQNG